ncbi:MAG: hypothetical protein R2736_18080 [Solirubrobacterales bacterium]
MRTDLHICRACRRPFVVPLFLLDAVDGRFTVALHCANCATLAVGEHDERELEALDRELDRSTAAMAAAADALKTGLKR